MKSTGRPKPKKISKHKKKGWKTIDTTDLEDYLDERSFEERTGGTISAKRDSDLFFVDKDINSTTDGEKPNRRNRKLRCLSILEPDPRIKPISSGKCTKSQSLKKLHPNMKKRLSDKLEAEFLSELNQYHTRKNKRQLVRERARTVPEHNYDLWAGTAPKAQKDGEDHILDVKIQKPVKPPSHHFKKPSALKAISTPHPGMSYNPTYDEHQNLLSKALKIELKKKKKEEDIERETVQLNIVVQKDKQKTKKVEEKQEDEEEMSDEDLDCTGINPAVRREDRKSQKHREHDRKVKLRARQKKGLKSIRIRESEVYRIKTFNKEFKAQEKETEKRKKQKQRVKKNDTFKTKRLGHAKFEEDDIELKLGKEISGSLRNLKPEGNVMSDRYKSFQKRNIITAPARIQKRKLAHVKFYEKRGHKEISEQAGV